MFESSKAISHSAQDLVVTQHKESRKIKIFDCSHQPEFSTNRGCAKIFSLILWDIHSCCVNQRKSSPPHPTTLYHIHPCCVSGMELLVNNKIISLDLPVADVYRKIWQPARENEPMRIVYRMRGLLGDATEDMVNTLASNNGKKCLLISYGIHILRQNIE